MTDIRKRAGREGITCQVGFATKCGRGYAYKTFRTLKEAKHYVETEMHRHRSTRRRSVLSVDQAIDKWLNVCENEGRSGKDPVSEATLEATSGARPP